MPLTKETINFSEMTEPEIKQTLDKFNIALKPNEILKIQNDILKRPPTLCECILWSIQGSEHSSYKSSRPFLKQFVTDGPDVVLGPSEDAGIVKVAEDEGHKYCIVMSHESHNHPSQIVPYEGAATGIGGNVRDVSCMGAKVIAVADPLRFGNLEENKTKWIHEGVVSGIAGYGNPIGVPNIGGDLYFNEGYNGNCLVNVVTLGIVRDDEIIRSRAPQNAQGYDLILVGKPTDNSGFGGASFASLAMEEEKKEQNKGAVQEPNAFLKRHLLKATYTLFEKLKKENLLDKVGFKDLGAGGISCASVELADAAGYGAEVYLDQVPVGMKNLHPSIILCSETQERYMWVAHPDISQMIVDHYNETFDLPNIAKGAKAQIIGKIRDDKKYVVTWQGEEIIDALAKDVTQGLLYDREYIKPVQTETEAYFPAGDLNEALLKILAHENIASRSPVFEQYDKNVQSLSVIEPGEADAGVMQPFKDTDCGEKIKKIGIALSVDHNPRYGQIDPYWAGVNAVVEAMRNVAAVGAVPHAITDCLCFGNPEKPEHMGAFVEATRGVSDACKNIRLKNNPGYPVPIISGNVSFYNESNGSPIPASPIISCLGRIEDYKKAITMSFKQADSILIMIGKRKDEGVFSLSYSLSRTRRQEGERSFEADDSQPQKVQSSPQYAGSERSLPVQSEDWRVRDKFSNIPKPFLNEVENQIFALTDAIDEELILAAHDISDGGIAVTLSEMSFGNEIGFETNIPGELSDNKKLFSETGGFVLEVEQEKLSAVRDVFAKRNVEVFEIGKTTKEKRIKMNGIDVDLLKAKERWENGLREKL